MALLLTTLGLVLLALSLAGITLGVFIALDARTRESGTFFALWWVSAAACAGGILMRDWVTFAIGAFCFAVAGVALTLAQRGSPRPVRGTKTGSGDPGETKKRTLAGGARRWLSGKAESREYRKAS